MATTTKNLAAPTTTTRYIAVGYNPEYNDYNSTDMQHTFEDAIDVYKCDFDGRVERVIEVKLPLPIETSIKTIKLDMTK